MMQRAVIPHRERKYANFLTPRYPLIPTQMNICCSKHNFAHTEGRQTLAVQSHFNYTDTKTTYMVHITTKSRSTDRHQDVFRLTLHRNHLHLQRVRGARSSSSRTMPPRRQVDTRPKAPL